MVINLKIFRLDQVQRDADEFMADSKQLEKEYESTIDQNERKIKELTLINHRSQNEIDALRVRLYQKSLQKLKKKYLGKIGHIL